MNLRFSLIYFFRLVLFSLIFYLPFQLALNLAPDIDLASGRLVILLVFGAWLFWGFYYKKKLVSFQEPVGTALLGLCFWAGISIFWAQNTEFALRKFLVWGSIFPLYFLVIGLFTSKRHFQRVISVVTWALLIIALIGIFQFVAQFLWGIEPLMVFWGKVLGPVIYGQAFSGALFQYPSWLVNIQGVTLLRVFSLLPDPHMLGFYLGLTIPLVAAGLAQKRPHLSPICYLLSVVVLILTFSRGAYLGYIFGMGSFLVLGYLLFSWPKRWFLVVSTLAVFLLFFLPQGPVGGRFYSSFDIEEGSVLGRVLMWHKATEVFLDNPLLGVGVGNFAVSVDPQASYRQPIYAHSLYLDLAAELGIVGLGTWLFLIGFSFFQLNRFRKKSSDNFLRLACLGLMASLVWFSVQALVETPIFSPRVLPMLMVILGLSTALPQLDTRN